MWLSFCSFFAPQGPSWPEGGFWLTLNLASSEAAPSVLSSEAAPAVLDGSQNDLQATDGPLPQPRTRDDVRVATQKSVVQPCPSPRELRGPCDLPQCSPNSVSMALLV